jgi:preprotein translocase subunit SecG
MTILPLLAVGILMKLVAFLFVVVCLVLIMVILIQKGRGGGLSGAFGGGMASGLLGSKTGDFLTWVTIGLVVVFLGLAVLMAKFFRPSVSEYGVEPPAATTQPVGTTAQPAATTEQPATTTEQPAPAAEPAATQPATAPATTEPAPQQPADGNGVQ